MRILLLSGHAPSNQVLSRLLFRLGGYDIEVAESITEATLKLAEKQFDILISGIQLPDGNGCDFMQMLSRTSPIKGIALTGYGLPDEVRHMLDHGFSARPEAGQHE